MASVALRGISKQFGPVVAVDKLDLEIRDHEFMSFLGPSGCGKTTTLNLIAGLETPSSGSIHIGEVDVTRMPAMRRDIAMVFQSYALYPHKTVAENMGFALKMRHVSKPEIAARVKRAAEILDLGSYLGRYPRQLSGGQRQRVAMGRAIVRDPQVFLFDEPLSNLDAKLRVQMRGEIKELHQRLKTTTVYVTHDQIEAMTMADRIVVLNDGIVEQVGSPLELYDRPANLFVAGFIGSPAMNMLKGRLKLGGGPRFITEDGVTLPVGRAPADGDGRPVIYGIRPEHFALGGTLEAKVAVVEPTGSETQVVAQVGEHKLLGVFRERIGVTPGETLAMTPDPGAAHLFDAETGLRLN